MFGRKALRARCTTTISRQLMFQQSFGPDQVLNAGLPMHRAPQPVLEVSVVTILLLEINPKSTPNWYNWVVLQGARALTQP